MQDSDSISYNYTDIILLLFTTDTLARLLNSALDQFCT